MTETPNETPNDSTAFRIWQKYWEELHIQQASEESVEPGASMFFFAGMRAGFIAALCISASSASSAQHQTLSERFQVHVHRAEVWALSELARSTARRSKGDAG